METNSAKSYVTPCVFEYDVSLPGTIMASYRSNGFEDATETDYVW
ncbi:MAG: hypothetical protein ACI39U_01145 [Candidatus Cryptobacteroides sp.]